MTTPTAPSPIVQAPSSSLTPAAIQEKGTALAEAVAAQQAATSRVNGLKDQLTAAQRELTEVTNSRIKAQQDLTDLLKG